MNSITMKTSIGIGVLSVLVTIFVILFAPLAQAEDGHVETGPVQKTFWSERFEIFVETPTLVKRKPGAFILYITDLATFKPFTSGKAVLALISASGETVKAEARKAEKPGMYKASVVPMNAGNYSLSLELTDDGGSHSVPLFATVVGESASASVADHPPHEKENNSNTISFLKEQQWAIEFDVKPPILRGIAPKTAVPGELTPVSNAECVVMAPLAGMVSHEFQIPYLGQHVKKGDVLAHLEPPLQQEGGADQLAVSLAEAESRVLLAQKEFDRAARLYEIKAAPRKRLEEAEIMLKVAKAAIAPIRKSVGKLQKGACHHVIIKAPISGTVTEINAPNGSIVQPGQGLLRIINPDVLWLKANVPVAAVGHTETFSTAHFSVAGFNREFHPTRLVTVSDLVDPKTRTVPVIFEVPNPDHALKVGMFVNVFLSDGKGSPAMVTIPETALFEDEGKFFVYVQTAGETFRRQEVTLGVKDRGDVQILQGVKETDRIVTKGGYYVKQASQMSNKPQGAHDGHDH